MARLAAITFDWTEPVVTHLDSLLPALQSILSGGRLTDRERSAAEWASHTKTLKNALKDDQWLLTRCAGIRRGIRRGLAGQKINYFERELLTLFIEALAPFTKEVNDTLMKLAVGGRA